MKVSIALLNCIPQINENLKWLAVLCCCLHNDAYINFTYWETFLWLDCLTLVRVSCSLAGWNLLSCSMTLRQVFSVYENITVIQPGMQNKLCLSVFSQQ